MMQRIIFKRVLQIAWQPVMCPVLCAIQIFFPYLNYSALSDPYWVSLMLTTLILDNEPILWKRENHRNLTINGAKAVLYPFSLSLGMSCQRSAGIKIYLLHTQGRSCALNHNMELFVSGSLCCYLCRLSGACGSYSFSHLNLSRSSSGLLTRDT